MILLFLNIGGGELLILLLVVLLVFGPKQAMDVARKTGKVLNEFKKVTQSVKDEIMKEANEIMKGEDKKEEDKKEIEQTTTI
jgi:sec-independent protein translocase protein TatA